MAHELHNTELFDVNGTKYLVGLDEYGYVQIQTGEMRDDPDTGEDEFVAYEPDEGVTTVPMLDPPTAQKVAEKIRSLVN